MRLLVVSSNYLPQIGGVEIVVDNLVRHLAGHGCNVTLVTSRSGASRYGHEVRGGVDHYRMYLGIPGSGMKSTAVFPFLAPLTLLQLRRLVTDLEPDIINLHLADNATAYSLFIATRFNIPLVVSLHGVDVEAFPQEKPLYGWLLKKALRHAAAVTACSNSLLNKAGLNSADNKPLAVRIPNGVDWRAFAEAIPYRESAPYILTVSRLEVKKGVDVVIRGFAQLSETFHHVKLLVAGDGPELPALQSLVAEIEIEHRVEFLGRVHHEHVASLVAGCELFALGSRQEPFGIVLLEAMAAARPVVATAVGGVPEFVTHEYNGLLVPREDSDAMARAMARLLEDRSLGDTIGRHGQQLVRTQYTWAQQGQHFMELFQQVSAA